MQYNSIIKNLVLVLFFIAPSFAMAFCFDDAARRYYVNPDLLRAIARVESNMNPRAINHSNENGSYDIGLMQINSSWLPVLARYGIKEEDLFDPCVNVHVGAWILAQNFRDLGFNWQAIGAYNARSPEKRLRYALKVYQAVLGAQRNG